MKRSRVNAIMTAADETIRHYGFDLPPFANWTPPEFTANAPRAGRVIEGRCGCDITDYGQGRCGELGLFLFTLRKGTLADLQRGGGMCYAEKLLSAWQDQRSPVHAHVMKAEDIINRRGATLVVVRTGSDPEGNCPDKHGGMVRCDGIELPYTPVQKLRLAPGESVTLMPGDWHAFCGEGGDVLIGEVLTVNDDVIDNVLREPIGRFARIEEDVVPTHLLISDQEDWLN